MEQDDPASDDEQRQRVAETPDDAQLHRRPEPPGASANRPDGHDMIGIGGVPQPEGEPEPEQRERR
jgi:hypothetical protein